MPRQVPLLHWLCILIFWFKDNLEQKYYALQVRPDWGSNSWPADHDSTFHVTETPSQSILIVMDETLIFVELGFHCLQS